ncbi:SDR family NAD(P)-dependent oxidoreductase [Spirochaeta thermophila]|uniref:Estradiol 17-beta-dehydrogenase 12 n=1 Tax=Winmispira thermophila (strain ATCC 49972 / DSM 6192 / RI 19.B1) TaxID=665571 RepID=E0RPG3_WINT6|nr:SDR family NAD(P)-dependent oxidoreductase [Spirochaeta thermophila]ADN02745.1 estradiol 17-beta-dehydrogenase 12 [Spirochaeta thermophila DSM 6192]
MAYALVTGASRGLGRAFAEELAKRGFDLLLVSLPGERLPQVADSLRRRYGIDVDALEGDITCSETRARIRRILSRYGHLSVAVNNAGYGHPGPFDVWDVEEWEVMLRLNVEATSALSHLVVPFLERGRPSFLLNVASLAGFFPMPFFGVYASSKSYVLHFTLALREELKTKGITVGVLCPGGVLTNARSIEEVRAQGLAGRLSSFPPHRVASYALEALFKGKALIIPGWFNRFLVKISSVVPKELVAAVTGIRWRYVAHRMFHPARCSWRRRIPHPSRE